MSDTISLRDPSAVRVEGYGTIDVHAPYLAQEGTATWMHGYLDAHRDAQGSIDTRALSRAAMRHDSVSWQPMTASERTDHQLAVYVAHAAGQPWYL